MTFPILIGVLTLFGTFLAVPLFEFVFAVLLLVPLMWFLVAEVLLSLGCDATHGVAANLLYLLVAGGLLWGCYAVFGKRHERRAVQDYYPIAAWLVVYLVAFSLARSWPDFFAMGERLRDYALLASSIKSPVIPQEPWMSGAPLNYYVYWYRFGHFLSSVLGMETWNVYHSMTAFALAFYSAACFQVMRVIVKGNILVASLLALLVSFGSNVAGFLAWYAKDDNWWGPSRVVKGAINEFPAWSFLLGDLHPHFLNLGVFPFALLLLFQIVSSQSAVSIRLAHSLLLAVAVTLWMFASNAWEVPMWLGSLFAIAALSSPMWKTAFCAELSRYLRGKAGFDIVKAIACILLLTAAILGALLQGSAKSLPALLALLAGALGFGALFFPYKRELFELVCTGVRKQRVLIWSGFWLLVVVSLRLSGNHIVPEGGSVRLVRDPIEVTRTVEMLLHWGLPLILAAFASLLLVSEVMAACFIGFVLSISLVFDKAAVFLILLGLVQVWRMSVPRNGADPCSWSSALGDAMLLSGIGLILLPEFAFLDDAYGGENERMNTIFKAYTTAWGLVALGTASVIVRALSANSGLFVTLGLPASSRTGIGVLCGVVAVGLSMPFFFRTAKLRMPDSKAPILMPFAEGLSDVERKFPGSATAIRAIREQPDSIVLEAQGNAYDFTSFVSTLSGQSSFLGWANHVNLLTKQYGEVSRREKFTEAFYSETSCEKRLADAATENISFVVLGTREFQKYSKARSLDFTCFKELVRDREYVVYQVNSPKA